MPNLHRVVVTPTQQHMPTLAVLQVRDQLGVGRNQLYLLLPSEVENAYHIILAAHRQLIAIRVEAAAQDRRAHLDVVDAPPCP